MTYRSNNRFVCRFARLAFPHDLLSFNAADAARGRDTFASTEPALDANERAEIDGGRTGSLLCTITLAGLAGLLLLVLRELGRR